MWTDADSNSPLEVIQGLTFFRLADLMACLGKRHTGWRTKNRPTISQTSDGQTFLGAGQKKNEKILAGHNDLL